MPHDKEKAEGALKKLAERLQKGWKELHPVTEKQMSEVRAAVSAEWAQDEIVESGGAQKKKISQETREESSEKTKKSKSRGHDHGHSH